MSNTTHQDVTPTIPFIPDTWTWRNLRNYRADSLGFVRKAAALGDIVRVQMGPRHIHMLFHPDSVKHVLLDHQPNYGKKTRGFEALRIGLGNGLLTSEGAFWLRQRRIAQPSFSRDRIAGFAGVMMEEIEGMLSRWAPFAANGQPLEVHSEMNRLALRIVTRTLLGSELDHEADSVEWALRTMLQEAIDRITSFVNFPMSIPTPRNRKLGKALQALDKIVYGFIERRRRGEGDRNDLLSRLMSARDPETGEAMDDRQLRDELMTMFLAGHETTANALTWSWYLLSQHPSSRERLEAELSGTLDGKAPAAEDLPKLPYTAMVVKESMRLYPPAWVIARHAEKADVIGGARIEAGSFVFVCPFMTHRHPAFWEEPERFDPERFAAGNDAERPRFAYFPFGGGPRLCIGKDFALIEAELAVAAVAQRYRLELVPGHPVEAQPMITLRPRHGMRMTVHARS